MTDLRYCVVICVLGLATLATAREDKYEEVAEPINLRAILHNERLLKLYERCLMDEGPCPGHGQMLKKYLPDALQNDCKKCTEKQKVIARDAIKILMTEKQDVWKRLCTKYDPDGSYSKKHAARIAALAKQ